MVDKLPLEDNFEDVIAKTMRGRHLSESELAIATGVSSDILKRLIRGEFCDESALPKVATALQLDPDALTMMASRVWYPQAVSLEGLSQFNTPYRDMRVNAYLVWDPESKQAAVFDTGTDASVIIDQVRSLSLEVTSLFITHTHGDHIADLETLQKAFPEARTYSNFREPWTGSRTFTEGTLFQLGSLDIETRTTSGHSRAGTTYVINGLARPLAIVGDAIFASSMGGGIVSFDDAWTNNRDKILTLPDNTIICPGHGPLTSVGEEKRHNPFFAHLYRA